MEEMPKATNEKQKPKKPAGVTNTPAEKVPTLESQGIDKNLAKAARTAAKIPEAEFDLLIDKHREKQEKVTAATVKAMTGAAVQYNTGEHEWYTPEEFVNAARQVLGTITLDPASSEIANKTVKARRYFTKDNDGLSKKWSGRIWMNPPYEGKVIIQFIAKLVKSLPDIEQAIVLVNNATETKWFQSMATEADAVCFPAGRIRFIGPKGDKGSPLQGQAILYFGDQSSRFVNAYNQFGVCYER